MKRSNRDIGQTRVAGSPPDRDARLVRMSITAPLVLASALASAATITISRTADLRFGTIVTGSSSGTVTISPSGGRSCAGGISCLSSASAGAAGFQVSGDALTNYTIMLPASTTLTDGAAHSMSVDNFGDSLGGTGTTDATGTDMFSVGATLHVGAGQVPSEYQGRFDVMVEYQ